MIVLALVVVVAGLAILGDVAIAERRRVRALRDYLAPPAEPQGTPVPQHTR